MFCVSANQLRDLVIYVDDQVCGQITTSPGIGESLVVECPEPLTGKILKIEKQVQQVLNLAEVRPVLRKAKGCMSPFRSCKSTFIVGENYVP